MFASLRSRLWLSYALVIGVVLLVVGGALLLYLWRNPLATRQASLKLRTVAGILTNERFSLEPSPRLGQTLQRVDSNFDVRVMVFRPDGSLLADSRPDLAPPILPLERFHPEITPLPIALFGDASGHEWLYTGRELPEGFYLVLATPRPRPPLLSVVTDELFGPLTQAGLIAMLLSLVLAWLIGRWIAAPLQRMAAAAHALASGEHRPIKLQGPGEVQALARTLNEMNSRVHASQQSQREFLANVSHELKTPLTSIQGFAQAILDGTADSPSAAQSAAQVITDEASRMHRLVVDLLDLARLDAGTADLQRARLDLAQLVENVAEKFTPLAQEAQVQLRTEIEPLPSFVGDGDRLAQVFTNLVDNAIKHTPPGGHVTLRTRNFGSRVEVWVVDTGSGIPPDELSRIFERFYQLDKSRQGGDKRGVGLGLAIALEIVQAHGGTMYANSQLGEGSIFVVQLPVARPTDETLASSQQSDS